MGAKDFASPIRPPRRSSTAIAHRFLLHDVSVPRRFMAFWPFAQYDEHHCSSVPTDGYLKNCASCESTRGVVEVTLLQRPPAPGSGVGGSLALLVGTDRRSDHFRSLPPSNVANFHDVRIRKPFVRSFVRSFVPSFEVVWCTGCGCGSATHLNLNEALLQR